MTSIDTILENFASKADLATAIALLKADLGAEMSAMETRLTDKINRQTWMLIGAMFGMGTLASAIVGATVTVAHYLHW